MTEVEIWTTGQVEPNPGAAGWAAMLDCNGQRKIISGSIEHASNHRTEITAVIEALSSLKWPCRVTIYSRNQYLINTGSKTHGGVANADLWEQVRALCFVHDVTWKAISACPQWAAVKSRALAEMRSVGIEALP